MTMAFTGDHQLQSKTREVMPYLIVDFHYIDFSN